MPPEAVQALIQEHFALCLEHDLPLTTAGLANALGTCRKTLWEWRNDPHNVHSNALKKALAVIEHHIGVKIYAGNIGAIFDAKANHGWSEQQNEVATPVQLTFNLGELQSRLSQITRKAVEIEDKSDESE